MITSPKYAGNQAHFTEAQIKRIVVKPDTGRQHDSTLQGGAVVPPAMLRGPVGPNILAQEASLEARADDIEQDDLRPRLSRAKEYMPVRTGKPVFRSQQNTHGSVDSNAEARLFKSPSVQFLNQEEAI